jgi:hypothetical protein
MPHGARRCRGCARWPSSPGRPLGLILPPLTGIAPALALTAAIGLVLIQVGGISLHLSRGEAKMIGLNVALLILAGVEIWLATVWL